MRISDWSSDVCSSDLWKKDNPLKDLRQFKVQENELSYLNREQILKLLEQLQASSNVHVYLVAKICLSTGARWSEAEGLTLTQVRNGIIQFARTKSGKTRAVPISDDLEQEIHAHRKTHKDRKSVVEGKRESISVNIGGRRLIKKKKQNTTKYIK